MLMLGAHVARRPRSKQRAYRRVHVYERQVMLQRSRAAERAEQEAFLEVLSTDKASRRIEAAMRGCRDV